MAGVDLEWSAVSYAAAFILGTLAGTVLAVRLVTVISHHLTEARRKDRDDDHHR